MASYLTLAQFKSLSTMPSSFVDELEARAPGFVAARIGLQSGLLDSRLRKRYPVPFPVDPLDITKTPVIVTKWIADLVTLDCWQKRGYSPTDQSVKTYQDAAAKAEAEISEAANAVTGLFDLPSSIGDGSSAISKGDACVYSEQSPYAWQDVQKAIGREEDSNGGGGTTQ